MTRRRFISAMLATPVLGALYARQIEPRWVDYVRRVLPVTNLPTAWRGKTLVQLSDIHVGPHVGDEYLRAVFAKVDALAPDLVVHTGDFITYEGPPTLAKLAALLPRFPRGRLGTFGVPGNHDYGDRWDEGDVADDVAALLESNGCLVLRNQAAVVAGLTVVGLDDLWAKRCRPELIMPKLAPTEPAIVLSHNPDSCDAEGWGNYRGWVLCGHTHGGQCRAPFLRPFFNPVNNKDYVAGKIAHASGRRLYINRGLGHFHHVRFNARPEVTVFTLIAG